MNGTNEMEHSDFLKLDYDFIEYYVGMAKMVVYWHVKALGFKVVAYAGPETGVDDKCSYYIVKNDIKLVITAASQPSSYQIVSFVDLHGNGIKRIGINVENVDTFFEQALSKGAIPLTFPETLSDANGSVRMAKLKIFDDNEIVLINCENYRGDFLPGYVNIEHEWKPSVQDTELMNIDHLACALRPNEMGLWEDYFNGIFNSTTVEKFDERHTEEDIELEQKKIGMFLKVLQSENKKLNNVLVEPDREKASQIQLFIDQNYGAGIQHIAFSSRNIFRSVELLRQNGVKFTSIPSNYYDELSEKYPELDISMLKKHGVLCDVHEGALLFQVFTAPIGDRATFFYEIVQRVNEYVGFGLDNIQALFEAMENELNNNKPNNN